MLLLMQPRIRLAFWAASAHCPVLLSSSASTPKSFSSGLLSIHSLPSLYLCLGLSWPRCRTLHLAMLNFEIRMGPPPKPVKVPLDGKHDVNITEEFSMGKVIWDCCIELMGFVGWFFFFLLVGWLWGGVGIRSVTKDSSPSRKLQAVLTFSKNHCDKSCRTVACYLAFHIFRCLENAYLDEICLCYCKDSLILTETLSLRN